MKCACCKTNEADKDNTHFLTDGIIKTALNLDGSVLRETGLYFNLSNYTPFVEFNFQRKTSVSKLEKLLGRTPTEEEIERAKSNPFSVDKVFCTSCEKIFTVVENKFTQEILPLFRARNLGGLSEVGIQDIRAIRLFFELQIFRTAICEPEIFGLPEPVLEELRVHILNYSIVNIDRLKQFPLSVTYMQTLGGPSAYTSNQVGFSEGINPSLIFMNDFIVQFYLTYEAVRFFDFYNLNLISTFRRFTNFQENVFLVRILDDKNRQWFNHSLREQKALRSKDFYIKIFLQKWFEEHGVLPPHAIVLAYLNTVIGETELGIVKYTSNNFDERLGAFLSPFKK